MALVTRSKHIFLTSSSVGGSFAKLRGGVGSGQCESQSSLGTEADAVISGTVLDKLSRCKPGVLCTGSSQKQCQTVCCNPAILGHSKKERRKKLQASEGTGFLHMPFEGQSVIELVDGPPWSLKHDSLGVA